MSQSCGVPGCNKPKYTPSGSKSFSCKFWKLQQQTKQQSIQQQLDRNDARAKKVFEQQFDLDKLLLLRERFRNAEKLFDARKYVLTRIKEKEPTKPAAPDPTINKPVLGNVEMFERIAPQLDKMDTRSLNVSDLNTKLNTPIPDLFDPRAKEALVRHNDVLKQLINNVGLINQPVTKPDVTVNPQAQQLINEKFNQLEEQINTLKETLDKQSSAINHLLEKYAKSDVPLTDNLLRAMDKDPTAFDDYIEYVFKWSKFISRQTTHSKPAIFVCHSFQLAQRLFVNYPNVFSVVPYTDWNSSSMKNFTFEELFGNRFRRIVIIPDFNLIPAKYKTTRIAHLTGEYQHYSDTWNNSVPIDDDLMIEFDLMQYFKSEKTTYSFQSYDRLHVPTLERYNDEFSLMGDNYKYVFVEDYT